MRTATLERKTFETDITLTLNLDGQGKCTFASGIGFMDHMLSSFCRFALMDLSGACLGDLQVDAHHSVEDIGLCLGSALAKALGDKRGIARLGSAQVPMDETLAQAVLDLSGRPYLVFDAAFAAPSVGALDTQLAEEFFRAVSTAAAMTLHLSVPYGTNDHHKLEALFKAFGRALRDATRPDPRISGVLSTKGVLT